MLMIPFLAFCGTVQPDANVLRDHEVRLRQALSQAGLEMKEACDLMAIDQAQFCRQLSGIGHISLTRMYMLPPKFWQAYAALLAEDYGIPRWIVRAALVALATRSRRSPLRMTAEPRSEKRLA